MSKQRAAQSLLADLEEFLTSSATNVEWMTDQLRSAVSVATGLEAIIRSSIDEGRSVAIAGTAGSGKTHLLRSVGADPKYKVVPDLAALSDREWRTLFARNTRVIVAGNEGAFLQGMRKGYAGFSDIITALHTIQRGQEYDGAGPVVIDAAGFDPAGSHSVAKMLSLPLLKTFVTSRNNELAAVAWEMLSDEAVTHRIALLVEAASAEAEADGFTFRQLWQLVADLALGSLSDEPWFCRLLAGSSEVTRQLNQTFDVRTVPLPHIGNQLWHGDLHRLMPAFMESAAPVLERLLSRVLKSRSDDERFRHFADLRVLSLFGLRQSPLDSMLRSGSELWTSIGKGESSALLRSINRYFAYDLIELSDDLELWLQHDTERRVQKPSVQASLGSAASNEFEVIRSKVVANRPPAVAPISGGRRILWHRPTNATLSVTKDLVDGILTTRSHLVHDRKDVEYDWRITQFFEQVARSAARPDRLKVAKFDFQTRQARLMIWQLGNQIRKVTV